MTDLDPSAQERSGSAQTTVRSEPTPARPAATTTTPQKILICDDEPHFIEIVSFIVGDEGYQPIKAKDGAECVERACAEQPGLVLLDIVMPEMDGYAVCRELRQRPETRHGHIVMLTARAQQGDEQRALDAGADGYITKPVNLRELRQLFHRVLDS